MDPEEIISKLSLASLIITWESETMRNAKKIAGKWTATAWIPWAIWTILKNHSYITIGNQWLINNDAVIGLFIISLPSIVVFSIIAHNPDSMDYDHKFLVTTEIAFSLAYVMLVLVFKCNLIFSIICWGILTIPFLIDYKR